MSIVVTGARNARNGVVDHHDNVRFQASIRVRDVASCAYMQAHD